jgi:hypothetical protein
MGAVESPRQLVGAAIQEFFGALLMFLILWPFVGVFGNTWTAWLAHFFFVMLVSEAGREGGREGGEEETMYGGVLVSVLICVGGLSHRHWLG